MLLWLVIIPIIIAVILYILPSGNHSKKFAIAVQAALTIATAYVFLLCKEGTIVNRIGNFEGSLGIMLRADTLASVFIMLTAVIFFIAALYSYYEDLDRLYWFLLFIWEGLLTGIFLAGDIFNIFVLVEVATVVVSVHIMLKRDKRSMYDGMLYLMINTVSIQFYLFGIGYLYKLTGVLDMTAAAQAIKELDKSQLYLPYALIITSISLKCALMPLFSWLPKAHGTPGAPSSVSAILSGLHIKSGIYLFIRFQSVFREITVPEFFLIAGIVTGIAGFIFALSQSDIKLILAYHTMSQIGMIMIGLNVDNIASWTGAVYHTVNHALFKSALFLSAGIIVQIYGTRDINKIRGVLRRIPLMGTATIAAALGITGAPFFNGSISKYFIMSGTNFAVTGAIIFINLGTIISFIKYSSILFGPYEPEQAVVKISVLQQAAVLILGGFCLAGGIMGKQCIRFLFNVEVSVDIIEYLQKTIYFALSVITGLLVYKYFIRVNSFFTKIREIELGFRGACVSIGLFFAIILIVARLSA